MSRRGPTLTVAPPLPVLPGKASIPERRFAAALTRAGIRWEPQIAVWGGRGVPGGSVVDFYLPDYRAYVRIMGEYWHRRPEQMSRDDAQGVVLKRQGYRVIDIWVKELQGNLDTLIHEVLGSLGVA